MIIVGAMLVVVPAVPARASTTAWTLVWSPNPAGNNGLSDVACPATTRCFAVGGRTDSSLNTRPLIESWNGRTWGVLSGPPLGNFSRLNALTCVSATNCVAVGVTTSGTTTQGLIERWNGTIWLVVPSPQASSYRTLYDVSCVSATQCFAVGTDSDDTGAFHAVVERWNGYNWKVAPSPDFWGTQLMGVSCIAIHRCVAVGGELVGGVMRGLVWHWDGVTWSVDSHPTPGTTSFLTGVSCLPGSRCVAVGNYLLGTNYRTLVETWNGATWKVVPSPSPAVAHLAAGGNYLNGVLCTSATSCTAVGAYQNTGSAALSMVVHWDGAKWSILPSPNPGTVRLLQTVDCATPTVCFAVGYYGSPPGGAYRTFILSGPS